MPVSFILAALMMITWSPVSMNGVYCGFSLPARMRATRLESRPSVWSVASTMCHLRTTSPSPGKKVDISQTPKKVKNEPVAVYLKERSGSKKDCTKAAEAVPTRFLITKRRETPDGHLQSNHTKERT